MANADSVCVGNTAALQYFGSGGALPYVYDWQGQNPNALPSGFYEFSLTDANGCTDVVSLQVAEFPFLDAQISAFSNANNGANGLMELTISGGELPYDILWSTGDTDEVLDGIGQGTYSVTVTDANGCVGTDSQSIIDLDVVVFKNLPDQIKNGVESEELRKAKDTIKKALKFCSPIRNLPPDKYDIWKEIDLQFD